MPFYILFIRATPILLIIHLFSTEFILFSCSFYQKIFYINTFFLFLYRLHKRGKATSLYVLSYRSRVNNNNHKSMYCLVFIIINITLNLRLFNRFLPTYFFNVKWFASTVASLLNYK